MKTIAIYTTRSGKIAAEVFQHGPKSFSYLGTVGAGCEASLEGIAKTLRTAMRTRKGIQFSSGTDILK